MVKVFERIFIIILENKSEQAVFDNAFMKGLAACAWRTSSTPNIYRQT